MIDEPFGSVPYRGSLLACKQHYHWQNHVAEQPSVCVVHKTRMLAETGIESWVLYSSGDQNVLGFNAWS